MSFHPLFQLIEDYLTDKDMTKESFDLYQTILKQYTNYLKNNQIEFAKTSDVTKYIKSIKDKGYSVSWINLQLTAIKGLYRYLSDNQRRYDLPLEYAFDITLSIKNEQSSRENNRPLLTIEQAKQLIIKTKENRRYIWHYRDHAMIYLMLTTGIRGVEVRRLKKKDFSVLNEQLILYVQGKGRDNADEYVKIPSGVEEAINDYLSKREDKSPYIFVSHRKHTDKYMLSRTFFDSMFKRVLRDSGLSDLNLTPHALRHTAATANLLRGESLEQTRQFMRHSQVTSTMIYAHHLKEKNLDSQNELESFILSSDE
ncbi:phage integrase [Paracholeplasma brassicae]|uniref:Phage integrase n=1 Tax=Acholeplasma brassicae TaxID=61635 RepID=U4KM49_9MOLU|nr:tyrosine-type recombinase/integrase [Paracholeplasma brassicae]CCV65095.1 phage integrase [Paracholeplasma brassicae]